MCLVTDQFGPILYIKMFDQHNACVLIVWIMDLLPSSVPTGNCMYVCMYGHKLSSLNAFCNLSVMDRGKISQNTLILSLLTKE